MRDHIEAVVRRAWKQGLEVDVWIREKVAEYVHVQAHSDTEVVHAVVRSSDGNITHFPGTIGDGELLRIRRGVTIDSGSAAFAMPETRLPGSGTKPSEGSTYGQTLIGATGKVAANTGETVVGFRTAGGRDPRGTFQASDVNTSLACVAGIADGPRPGEERSPIFPSRGGVITPEAKTNIIMPGGS